LANYLGLIMCSITSGNRGEKMQFYCYFMGFTLVVYLLFFILNIFNAELAFKSSLIFFVISLLIVIASYSISESNYSRKKSFSISEKSNYSRKKSLPIKKMR